MIPGRGIGVREKIMVAPYEGSVTQPKHMYAEISVGIGIVAKK